MQAKLERIPLAKLVTHPDNPRVANREDVIEGIAAKLKEAGVFAEMHALIVRQYGDVYQILSGHQRREAAARAGLEEVPCWVVDPNDDEAFMLLVTCNAQGELTPLEYGIHALKAVPSAQGKRARGCRLTLTQSARPVSTLANCATPLK
jgi:ParB-like chromosome segregation protein Spo0J